MPRPGPPSPGFSGITGWKSFASSFFSLLPPVLPLPSTNSPPGSLRLCFSCPFFLVFRVSVSSHDFSFCVSDSYKQKHSLKPPDRGSSALSLLVFPAFPPFFLFFFFPWGFPTPKRIPLRSPGIGGRRGGRSQRPRERRQRRPGPAPAP